MTLTSRVNVPTTVLRSTSVPGLLLNTITKDLFDTHCTTGTSRLFVSDQDRQKFVIVVVPPRVYFATPFGVSFGDRLFRVQIRSHLFQMK